MKTKKLEVEEDLLKTLETQQVKPFTEELSFKVDDLLRRIPSLMDGPVCPLEEERCECTYKTGCAALKCGPQLPLAQEKDTTVSSTYEIVGEVVIFPVDKTP